MSPLKVAIEIEEDAVIDEDMGVLNHPWVLGTCDFCGYIGEGVHVLSGLCKECDEVINS